LGFGDRRPDPQALAAPFIEALIRRLAQQKVVKAPAGFKGEKSEKYMNAR
jgi:hypothetical protein